MEFSKIIHPEYEAKISDWSKFRIIFEGGRTCVDKYLEKFSSREKNEDFNLRKKVTHCPAHAKAAVNEVKNSICQRMIDIQRIGGPDSFNLAIQNKNGGIDLNGNSMNSYLARIILPELLSVSKIGVYIDNFEISENLSKAQTKRIRPYVYHYVAEDIRTWSFNEHNELITLLLRDHVEVKENDLIVGHTEQYRLLQLIDEGVEVSIYSKDDELISKNILNLSKIPFVIFELNQSLLEDIADYQITLLNLGSSDIGYLLSSNYPFYTEQFDPASIMPYLRQAHGTKNESDEQSTNQPGTAASAAQAGRNEIKVGASQGRRYAKGMDRPAFINPSSEPVEVSMKKQDVLIKEIRQLLGLALTNIRPMRASVESKQLDEQGLEAGLSYIGVELEYGEQQIAEIWALYEGQKDTVRITYPSSYSIRTDEDRRKEAKELKELQSSVPSKRFQIEVAKQIATVTIGHKIKSDNLQEVHNEIENADIIETDPEILRADHEAGFISTKSSSKARFYPEGESEQAKKDHAERAARIAAAQSQIAGRGTKDLQNLEDSKVDKDKP